MAAVGTTPDPEVAARCRELGIKSFAHFARRYGRRITDLTAERALEILGAEIDGPGAKMGQRWENAVTAAPRTKAERDEGLRELYAAQLVRWKSYLKGRDEEDGYYEPTTEHDADADSRDRGDDRPVFGDAIPARANGRARSAERLSIFGGVDGG